jgi:hypothetical protein
MKFDAALANVQGSNQSISQHSFFDQAEAAVDLAAIGQKYEERRMTGHPQLRECALTICAVGRIRPSEDNLLAKIGFEPIHDRRHLRSRRSVVGVKEDQGGLFGGKRQ